MNWEIRWLFWYTFAPKKEGVYNIPSCLKWGFIFFFKWFPTRATWAYLLWGKWDGVRGRESGVWGWVDGQKFFLSFMHLCLLFTIVILYNLNVCYVAMGVNIFTYNVKYYIIACNYLRFLKIFSNFVHFCPNF